MALLPAIQESPSFNQSPMSEKFQLLLSHFAEYLQTEGIEIRAFDTASIEKFNALAELQQENIVNSFQDYYAVCSEHVQAGGRLRDTIALTRRMFSKNKWEASEEFFNELRHEDVVEVYRADFTQLFRNMKFLEVCSYPLSELYVTPWPELYRRPQSITDKVISEVQELLSSPDVGLRRSEVPVHFIEEVFSERRNFSQVTQKDFAPVFKNDRLVGFVGSLGVKFLGSKLDPRAEYTNVRPLSL